MRLIIRPSFDRDGYHLWLMSDDKRICKPINLEFGEKHDDAFLLPQETLFLRAEDFKKLRHSIASEALANGFTELVNPFKDQLAAVKYHLEDMRRLVFEPTPSERIVLKEDR